MCCFSVFPHCCTDASLCVQQEAGHQSANLQSYKDEVKGRVWSLSPLPRPCHQRGPRGAHPTLSSIRRKPGEVSLQQVACHFPSLPIARLPSSVSHTKGKVIKQTTLMRYVIAASPVAFACTCARSRGQAR